MKAIQTNQKNPYTMRWKKQLIACHVCVDIYLFIYFCNIKSCRAVFYPRVVITSFFFWPDHNFLKNSCGHVFVFPNFVVYLFQVLFENKTKTSKK